MESRYRKTSFLLKTVFRINDLMISSSRIISLKNELHELHSKFDTRYNSQTRYKKFTTARDSIKMIPLSWTWFHHHRYRRKISERFNTWFNFMIIVGGSEEKQLRHLPSSYLMQVLDEYFSASTLLLFHSRAEGWETTVHTTLDPSLQFRPCRNQPHVACCTWKRLRRLYLASRDLHYMHLYQDASAYKPYAAAICISLLEVTTRIWSHYTEMNWLVGTCLYPFAIYAFFAKHSAFCPAASA